MAVLPRRRRRLFAAAVIIVGICAPITFSAAAERPETLECGVRGEVKDGFLQLSAVVRSREPVSGRYQFIVSKRSQSGSSENAQSGAFTLGPEPERVLTTTLLDRGAVGHYQARLSIETKTGTVVSCSSP